MENQKLLGAKKVGNMPNIYLIGHAPKEAIYIGRGSSWGNPYVISEYRTRKQSIKKFSEYAIWKLKHDPGWLVRLWGKDLVCFCAPLPCHGDVLLEMASRNYQEKGRPYEKDIKEI